MQVSATEAKNRLGQMLEHCQREPVTPRTAKEFSAHYKEWINEQNRHFDKYGIWNEEFRTW